MIDRMQDAAVSDIASRLRDVPIHLPGRMGDDVELSVKEKYLKRLLQEDPGIFLERYGDQLSSEERSEFFGLRFNDFEVDHYLKQLEGANEDKLTVARNRRVALMKRLEAEGEYFSEVIFSACNGV